MIRWLFNLDYLPSGDEFHVGWLTPWPIWIWILVVIGILVFTIWCYQGSIRARKRHVALGCIRFLLLVFVAILLNGPVLESHREYHTSDQVLVLIDESGSMGVPDVVDDRIEGNRITRQEQVRRLLEETSGEWNRISNEREVRWFGFHGHPFERDPPDTSIQVDSDRPLGNHTRIDESIARAIAVSAGGPISAAVVFSDGRSDHGLKSRPISDIRSAGVKVVVVPIGSAEAMGDLVLESVTSPDQAFTGDRVPVQVAITRRGSANEGFDIVLRDRRTGTELDRTRVDGGEETRVEETLMGVPDLGGTATWSVTIEPDQPDLVIDNNQKDLDVELLDEPLRVLYVEGSPRWEYRYLKNLMIREKSIESSIMLLSADRSFAQEGDRPLSRLPVTFDEFKEFDVIIIGDVPSGVMSPEQHHLLQEAVASGGAGLLWIGGELSTPSSWAETDLADTFPFNGPFEMPNIGSPVQMQPTDEARRTGVLQLSEDGSSQWPDVLQNENTEWSKLQWAQWIQPSQLKPTSSVLAETIRVRDQDLPIPLIMAIRYGIGRSIYVATDEIWRWRYGRGEQLGEQFWIQLIRHLGRASLAAAREIAELVPSQRQIPVGQVLQLKLRVFDESTQLDMPDSMSVSVINTEGRLATNLDLQQSVKDQDTWTGTWVPAWAGTFRLTVDLKGVDVETQVRVEDVTLEYQKPETDHDSLASLAEMTGGEVIDPGSIETLFRSLPDRSINEIEIRRAGLWDAPFIFILLMILLTLEWTGRRLLRLA